MPELTPAMAAEIDRHLVGLSAWTAEQIDVALAAQRAEIALRGDALDAALHGRDILRAEIAALRQHVAEAEHEIAEFHGELAEAYTQRDALVRVARAAARVLAWELDPDGTPEEYDAASTELERALAPPEVQALLASRPEARPEGRP